MAFDDSTQKRYWLFTRDELQQIRARTCEGVSWTDLAEETAGRGIPRGDDGGEDIGDSSSEDEVGALEMRLLPGQQPDRSSRELLSASEQAVLRLYYEMLIENLCRNSYRFPDNVTATAVGLFKRFYLRNPLDGYNPARMCVACVVLACKAEEVHIDLGKLFRAVKLKEDDESLVVRMELPLLEGVRFHLQFHHPFRPLRGLVDQLGAMGESKFPRSDLADLFERAQEACRGLLFTDACFLVPPSRLALASLRRCAAGQLVAESAVAELCRQLAPDAASHRQLVSALDDAVPLFDEADRIQKDSVDRGKEVMESVKQLSKKLSDNQNPLFNPNSAEFRAAQEARAAAREKLRVAHNLKRQVSAPAATSSSLAGLFADRAAAAAGREGAASGDGDRLSKKRKLDFDDDADQAEA